jgi:hypothetical protein
MRTFLLLPLVTVGCFGPQFVLDDPLYCPQPVVEIGGGLTAHLALGGLAGGVFDYDPPGRVTEEVVGSYDLRSGDFSWTEIDAPASWRADVEVEGYGYAATNGDLDVEYTRTVTDVLGNTFRTRVREERDGCSVRRKVTDPDDSSDLGAHTTGIFGGGVFTWRTVVPIDAEHGVEIDGVTQPDRTYVSSAEYREGISEYSWTEAGDPDEGYTRRDYRRVDQDDQSRTWTTEGYWEEFLDGKTHYAYAQRTGSTRYDWDYTVDYAGNGSGTVDTGSGTCTLEFTAGACTYDCGGTTGEC